jgi:UDP-N-acetylmuramoyl-tripeptide--D-alanyl-D-alanine ligase
MQPLLGEMGNLIIDDTYNANPSSLQAALAVVATLEGERWLALGAFGELGENSAEMHRDMGNAIKQSGISRLFAVGENTRYTVEQFGAGAMFFTEQSALIDALKTALTGQETILIKGSRSQKMENVAAALVKNFRA